MRRTSAGQIGKARPVTDGEGSLDHSKSMRVSWPIILVAVVVGCGPSSTPADDEPHAARKAGVLDEIQVLAIAREAVATNDTWIDRAEFETPKRQPDGSWRVRVWRLPKVPGGHRFISIDENGQVTAYGRGL